MCHNLHSKGGDGMTDKTTRDMIIDAILEELSDISDAWLLIQILDLIRNVKR